MVAPTQHSETDNANIPAPSVWEVVDKALVGAGVRRLGVVDEDGGTCAWHGGHEAHSPIEMVGKAEHLTTLVNYHLRWVWGQRQQSKKSDHQLVREGMFTKGRERVECLLICLHVLFSDSCAVKYRVAVANAARSTRGRQRSTHQGKRAHF